MNPLRQFLKNSKVRRLIYNLFVGIGDSYNIYLVRGNMEASYRFTNPVMRTNGPWFYSLDLIRCETAEFLSREIYEKGLEGEVAEVGVYQGEFAALINHLFPDKQLYLFDTFEGFDSRDMQVDAEKGFDVEGYHDFSATSVESVSAKMPHKENVVIKKGWFPDSAAECEDKKFCFVSLDVDLYQPIYAALHWFYPRLVEGGYIMVDDYSTDKYKGVKEAVRTFASEVGVSYFVLPDVTGSVVIGKPIKSCADFQNLVSEASSLGSSI